MTELANPAPEAHPVPMSLVAELTHRCPLSCVYCSNPAELQKIGNELGTGDWKRVFGEAAALGVVQLHLTGGEPVARDDLVELVRHGREKKLYVNLITSGVGLKDEKLKSLCDAGLDHVQLSFQDSTAEGAREISGTSSHRVKLEVAKSLKRFPLAFTVNFVVHRRNLARLPQMIEMAEALGADRMEIAHAQYYGWAFKNRALLLPTREQLKESIALVTAARERLKGKIKIEFTVPDYHAKFPKPCMNGWGQKALVIDPAGRVLPCHSAMVIPELSFDNVKDRSLEWIWTESQAFARFRGEKWMKPPCRDCDRRTQDFGGCRCQAYLITGDASATDPVCSLSADRGKIDAVISSTNAETSAAWIYRKYSESKGSQS